MRAAAQVDLGRPLPVQAAIDAHFWGEADAVEVRADLADAGIYLCAPEVLLLFSDNFDYQARTPLTLPQPVLSCCGASKVSSQLSLGRAEACTPIAPRCSRGPLHPASGSGSAAGCLVCMSCARAGLSMCHAQRMRSTADSPLRCTLGQTHGGQHALHELSLMRMLVCGLPLCRMCGATSWRAC